MSKSYVTLEQSLCTVCLEPYDTGSILMDRRLKETFERTTVTGVEGLCPTHQKMYDDEYVALVVVGNHSTGNNQETLQLKEANRTGVVIHVRSSVMEELFTTGVPKLKDGKPCHMVFIDEEAAKLLEDLQACSQDS